MALGEREIVIQLCLTLCNSVDCSPLGSSVHGILQARIVEWVAIPFSRGSSWLRDWTQVSCTGRQILYEWATREALSTVQAIHKYLLTINEWKARHSVCVFFLECFSGIYYSLTGYNSVVGTIIIPILQKEKLKQREVQTLPQGHTTNE